MSKGVIVAGIDGSTAARGAARWAALDAERRRVTLRLVHAVAPPTSGYPEPLPVPPRITEQLRTSAGQLLQHNADELRAVHPGLRIETAQHDGAPVKVLLEQ